MAGADQPTDSRMVADRFRRIWGIVQTIADEPGHTRAELARMFSLSARQIQADLNIIRGEMRLPLIRRQGYRFADETGAFVGRGALDFGDMMTLVGLLSAARAVAFEPGEALAVKLARLAPLHLQPLARELFIGEHREALRRIAEACLRPEDEKSVRVVVALHGTAHTETLRPELIVPYQGRWYIVGQVVATGRNRMWRLDRVASVEPVAIRLERKTRGAA